MGSRRFMGQARRAGKHRATSGMDVGPAYWWWLAGGALLAAAIAALADRRRHRRRDLDRPGWVPWPVIQILAMLMAAVATAFALKS